MYRELSLPKLYFSIKKKTINVVTYKISILYVLFIERVNNRAMETMSFKALKRRKGKMLKRQSG